MRTIRQLRDLHESPPEISGDSDSAQASAQKHASARPQGLVSAATFEVRHQRTTLPHLWEAHGQRSHPTQHMHIKIVHWKRVLNRRPRAHTGAPQNWLKQDIKKPG